MNNTLRLASPQYWPAWFGLGLLWLITRLPYRWQIHIGEFFGRILYLFPGKIKETTYKNLELCFPEHTKEQRIALAKNNYAALGVGIIEAGMAWWLSDKKLSAVYKIHGLEYAEAAFKRGKGIILVGPHFTCLEMIGRLLGMHYTFAVMYRPHKKAMVSFIHERFRKRKSVQYIKRHRMRELIRALNENKAVWYAYDVDGGRKRTVFAPLFGIQTASLTTVSRIIKMSDAAVIPISFYRRDNEFGYDIILSPPLENFPGQSLEDDAKRLNASVELGIRTKPEQYVWQYKRFKTRPVGEKRFY